MTLALDKYSFDYTTTPINDIQVEQETDAKTGAKTVTGVIVQDEKLGASDRFWTSLFARYGFGKQFFSYFSHQEVFDRIAEIQKNDRVRVCIERNQETGKATLMAASMPTKPLVGFDDLVDMLSRYHGVDIQYHDGIVESSHTPRAGSNSFNISGDVFSNRFLMATPVDGYGQPNIYLSLLRRVCSNGMIGFSKAFRSQLSLGKGGDDVAPAITRALDGFGNDEGYAALRQRLESSQTSWASVFETTTLYKLLVKLHSDKNLLGVDSTLQKGSSLHEWATTTPEGRPMGEEHDTIGSPIIRSFHSMTGDTSRLYGLANLDALTQKRQRTLPTRCTVYDCINFATEVATHYAKPQAARRLNAWVGSMISGEYDMEGTRERFEDFQDFFITAKLGVGLTGSEHQTN